MSVALSVKDLAVQYKGGVQGVRSVSLEVPEGAMIALLGANGAGKTTVLRAVSSMLKLEGGAVVRGSIELFGTPIKGVEPHKVVHMGMFHCREGRHIFSNLTVEENLLAATFAGSSKPRKNSFDEVYDFFPKLRERRKQLAGYLSGGEQQMLVLGRALVANPRVLLLDEPSLGLAPKIVHEIFRIIASIQKSKGMSVLIVEQNASVALQWVNYGYVIESGCVVTQGNAASLLADPEIGAHYLGGSVAPREFAS